QYLGWDADDPRVRSGVRFLLTHPPRWADREADAYYWYYASQACLHAGGPEWPKWNGVMRDFLIEKQQRRGRPEPGSWSPDFDIWGRDGGRLYTTCLSIYTLEVYYRHLPLYQQRAVR
ncbi:MAG: squalene--hopene cyclase, partial [Planctomycetota bacterium]